MRKTDDGKPDLDLGLHVLHVCAKHDENINQKFDKR